MSDNNQNDLPEFALRIWKKEYGEYGNHISFPKNIYDEEQRERFDAYLELEKHGIVRREEDVSGIEFHFLKPPPK